MSDQQGQTAPRLEGKVAMVINARELAINIGSENGVQLKMKFAVLAAEPAEIRDPETNALLGTVEREKIRVEVTNVEPKFAVCRTYKNSIHPRWCFCYQRS